MEFEKEFPYIKSIISDCICKSISFVETKIPEKPLNLLANEYADKVIQAIREAGYHKDPVPEHPPKGNFCYAPMQASEYCSCEKPDNRGTTINGYNDCWTCHKPIRPTPKRKRIGKLTHKWEQGRTGLAFGPVVKPLGGTV